MGELYEAHSCYATRMGRWGVVVDTLADPSRDDTPHVLTPEQARSLAASLVAAAQAAEEGRLDDRTVLALALDPCPRCGREREPHVPVTDIDSCPRCHVPRQVVRDLLGLPVWRRVQVAEELGLCSESERECEHTEYLKRVFARAAGRGLAAELAAAVAGARAR